MRHSVLPTDIAGPVRRDRQKPARSRTAAELDSAIAMFLICSVMRTAMVDDRTVGEPFPTEADVDAVLAEFDGNARAAVRALLHDIAVLASDFEASVSHGFVRGAVPKLVLRRRA